MAGDFDSLMAGMGVKRMEDDKHQAKATRKVKAKATTVRRKANASAAPQAPASVDRTPELERAIVHMKAKREEAEEKLAKSKRRNTKLKKALVEAEEKLQSAQQTVADVLGEWGFDTPAKRASVLSQPGILERVIGTPALWDAEELRVELTDRTIAVCAKCEPPDDRRVIPVEASECAVCGGVDVASAARHVVDAALINGRLRILMVGRDTSHHRQIRAQLTDKRMVLTQLPGTVRRDRASARMDVEHSDAIVIWDPSSVDDALLEIYRSADRVGEVEAGPLGVFLEAAAGIIGDD